MHFQNKLKTRIITKDLESIPFEEAARIWDEAASRALAREQHDLELVYRADYEARVARLTNALGSSEASFEGDVNLPYEPPTLDPKAAAALRLKEGNAAIAEQFLKPYQMKSFGTKVMEQIIGWLSTHKLNRVDGKICGKQYMSDNFDKSNPRHVGIYRFLMLDSRGDYLVRQTEGPGKTYNSLVPLILYAHKLYHNVDYSQWDRNTLHFVVNKSLREAMLFELTDENGVLANSRDGYASCGLGSERLLELRDIALAVKGKPTLRPAASTYSLYFLGQTELADVPALARIMLLQTWCAHPTNRTKYMVLDPNSWDTMPPPLASANIFKSDTQTVQHTTSVKPLVIDDWQ